jgi:uncharacterized membrane protein HdeD (DUF308 family)
MPVISGPWWSWLLRGIAALAFGVLAILWPGITFLVFVAMFAAYALVDGIIHLAASFRAAGGQPRWLLAFQGILGVAVAILTFMWPGITALALLFLIGAWAIVGGAMRIALAIQLRKVIAGEWLLALSGVMSIIFGVLVYLVPVAGVVGVAFMVGFYAIVLGIVMMSLAMRLRRFERTVGAAKGPQRVSPPQERAA